MQEIKHTHDKMLSDYVESKKTKAYKAGLQTGFVDGVRTGIKEYTYQLLNLLYGDFVDLENGFERCYNFDFEKTYEDLNFKVFKQDIEEFCNVCYLEAIAEVEANTTLYMVKPDVDILFLQKPNPMNESGIMVSIRFKLIELKN